MSRIKPRTARVVIYQGDDLARLADLDDAVAPLAQALSVAEMKVSIERRSLEKAAENTGAQLLSEDGPDLDGLRAAEAALEAARASHADVSARRDAFAAEAEERGVVVQLIARPRLRWRELHREHPARVDKDGNVIPADAPFGGINIETLPDVLLLESIDREMSTIEGDTAEFLDSLSDYDYYDVLFMAAFGLNRGSAPADPTQRLLSGSSQTSAATSS